MRASLLITLALAASALAPADTPSKHDLKQARKDYQQGLKLQKQDDLAGALAQFQAAARLAPSNPDYMSAVAQLRAALVTQDLRQGDASLRSGNTDAAAIEFASALTLDPANSFAQQRLRDALPAPSPLDHDLEVVDQSTPLEIQPKAGEMSQQFSGDSQTLLTQVASAFGLTAIFDSNFNSRTVAVTLDHAGFRTAIAQATSAAHTLWTPLTPDQVFFAADTPENHRQFDRMELRTFYLANLSTLQDLNDAVSALRVLFNIRYLNPDIAAKTITVRAPRATLDLATQFLSEMATAHPQVLLDVDVFEINHAFLRQLGVQLPMQFQIINLGAAALALANTDSQQQINNIIANGGITPQNQAAIQALEAQLQAQQNSAIAPLLNTPFATFGGGLARFAVTIPPVSASFQFNQSMVKNLEHITLRAGQGDSASLMIGTRFPVLTSSFGTPSTSTPLATTPTFNFEDLGVTLKAKPQIHIYQAPFVHSVKSMAPMPENEVTLELDLAIKSLSGESLNNIPVISNREFKGTVRLGDGEPALVAGAISRDQQRSLSGVPLVGQLPVLKKFLSTENNNTTDDEILVIITPHIVRLPDTLHATELWLPNSN